MEIKMKKEDVNELYGAIMRMRDEKTPFKFSYGLAKNKALLDGELKAINKAGEKLKDYDKGRTELAESHSKKDKDGKAVVSKNGTMYEIIDRKAFDEDFEVLKEKHKEVLDEWKVFMDSPCELKFHKILKSDFPKEISTANVEGLMPFMEDVNGSVRQ